MINTYSNSFDFEGVKFDYKFTIEKQEDCGPSPTAMVVLSVGEEPELMLKMFFAIHESYGWDFEFPEFEEMSRIPMSDETHSRFMTYHVVDGVGPKEMFLTVLTERYFVSALHTMMSKDYNSFGNNAGGMRFKMPKDLHYRCVDKAQNEANDFFDLVKEKLNALNV